MRAEKASLLEEIKQKIQQSPFILVTEYSGMNVPQFSELRKRLRGVGARYAVVKNTVLRKVVKDLGFPPMDEVAVGQSAIVVGQSDVCAAAKILKNFSAEFSKPKIRGGILDGALLSVEQVKALGDLPSREVLLAQLLGLLNTPATRLASVISAPGGQLARVVQAKVDKGE